MSSTTGHEEREYRTTHPWLSFTADLSQPPAEFWMLLGEARSKIEHIQGSLLKPSVADKLHVLFLAKGALATTAIEGNTLSEEQAVQAVEGTLVLPPSQEYLLQELRNIVKACNAIKDDLVAGGSPELLSVDEIKAFNRAVLDGLELDDGVVPGEVSRPCGRRRELQRSTTRRLRVPPR